MKVLIIEDEDLSAKTLSFQLQNLGHETQLAQSGQSALRMIEHQHFDLLICDIILPDISGISIAQLTLSFFEKKIPIIFISILENAERILIQNKVMYHAFLAKPVSNEALLEQIDKYCATK